MIIAKNGIKSSSFLQSKENENPNQSFVRVSELHIKICIVLFTVTCQMLNRDLDVIT